MLGHSQELALSKAEEKGPSPINRGIVTGNGVNPFAFDRREPDAVGRVLLRLRVLLSQGTDRNRVRVHFQAVMRSAAYGIGR